MCTRPIEHDGNVFACRTCDECISTRRHNWVARAMMEKAMHRHCICLALSYDDSTQANRDAAAMFQYIDVRRFFARVREAIKAAGGSGGIRFICAGEQGDRNGRCHWHVVLYSDHDLTSLGIVELLKNGRRVVVTDRKEMLSVGKKKVRCNWSLWGHGFVTFQEPDQGGMHYVLSYCLKDQFTEEKAKETARQHKVENFATGLFRMSKRPAIGEAWLWQKMAALEEKGACLANLNIKVPGLKGQYQPAGSFRDKLLYLLVALNKRHVWTTGQNLPQWSTLLASLADFPPDYEVLNGPQTEQDDPDNAADWLNELRKRQRETAGFQARREFAHVCGNEIACEGCLSRQTDSVLASFGVERYVDGGGYFFRSAEGFDPLETRQRRFVGKSNPLCQKRGSRLSRHTFPASDNVDLRQSQGRPHVQTPPDKNGR